MSGVGTNFQAFPFQGTARVLESPLDPTAQTSSAPTTDIPVAIWIPPPGVGVGSAAQVFPFQCSNRRARVSASLSLYQPAAQRSSELVPAIASSRFVVPSTYGTPVGEGHDRPGSPVPVLDQALAGGRRTDSATEAGADGPGV